MGRALHGAPDAQDLQPATDPYERADFTSNTYSDCMLDHAFLLVPAQAFVAQMVASFLEFPPRQESATFGIKQALDKLRLASPARIPSSEVADVSRLAGSFDESVCPLSIGRNQGDVWNIGQPLNRSLVCATSYT